MKYVYPNNLLARRSEKKEMIKGGILLAVFILVIAGLFFASEYGQSYSIIPSSLHCIPEGTEMNCRLQ
tara:strand:+ start:55 stop:258 length:204 start_codon:yes stop_codon:yes gene_type:complete